jgi:two-component system chemotaxis response regulator CheY
MRRPGKPRRVVIVDDDKLMRKALRLILQSENYAVVGEGVNGVDAIYLCETLMPDLVLLDINMPAMNGLSALEEIHKISPSTKVLMVSIEAKKDKVEEAIKMGASGFVVKPLNAGRVLERIEACFEGNV